MWWGWHGLLRGPLLLGGCLMFLFWIAVIVLVVWLIVRLVRGSNKPAQVAPQAQAAPPLQIPQPDPVLETLRRRLADGAITAEEYDALRQKLGV